MKKKLLFIFFAFCLSPGFLPAQTDTTIYQQADFYSSGQSLWGPGVGTNMNIDKNFFSTPLLNGGFNFGGITDVAGYDFGATFSMSCWAQFGSGLTIRLGGEKVVVDYQSDVKLTMPAPEEFNKGQEITVGTQVVPDEPHSKITYDDYNFLFKLWMNYRLGANVSGQACIFDCYPFSLVNFDIADTINLLCITDTTMEFFNGLYQPANDMIDYFIDNGEVTIECPPPPMDIGAPPLVCAFSLTFSSPSNESDLDVNSINQDVLTCDAAPNEYVNLTLSIPAMISDLFGLSPEPVSQALSQIFGNLSNSWSWGQFSFEYTILETGFQLGLYHNKTLYFDPNMRTQMSFPYQVDYKILKPDNSLVTQGTDSIVRFDVGNKLKFRYPCNFEFMDVKPDYSVTGNTFRNHTYDSLSFRFFFEMLSIAGGMPDITVIPAFCFDLWYPCPSWSDPFDWCSDEVCVPALVFPGYSFNVPPLVDYDYEFVNYVYDWVDNTWTMGGFDTVHAPPFRLTPAKYAVTASARVIPCFGQNNGTATAIVSNGTPPYRYEWSNGVVHSNQGSKTDVVANLGAGTHYVIVTDANGCATFADVIVSAPEAPLALSNTITPVLCNGNSTGAIALGVTGGTDPYTYQWNSGQTSQDISGVTAGTYYVTVTDNMGCTGTQQFVISQPSVMTAIASATQVNCFGAGTGTLSVNATGGVVPFSYLWSNGSTAAQVNNVTADVYTVTVTDFNGCQNVQTATVTQPAAPVSLSYAYGDVLCYGETSGYIHISPTGGTLPYNAAWYNQSGQVLNQSAISVDSLGMGAYTAVITDAHGCSLDTTVLIHQPPQINWGFTTVDNLCFGESNGQINLTVSGGTPTYTYSWSNSVTSANLNGLQTGTYTVTITDQNGCKAVTSASIFEPAAALAASVIPTSILCWGNATGQADLIANGGTAPYTYLWSTGVTTEDLSSVEAGNYTVTVTDNNNCSAFSGVVISQPADSLNVLATLSPATCHGLTDGDIFIQASGGTTPYYLRWDNTDFLFSGTGHLVEDLGAGVYQVIVSDANGCQYEQSYTITAPETILLEATSTLVHCFGGADGSIALTASGGISPYQYVWNNGATSKDLSGLQVGRYIVTVTDANGCSSSLTTDVNGMPVINVTGSVVPISCIDNLDGRISIVAEGGAGGYSYLWSTGSTQTLIENLSAGEYSLTVTDAYGCNKDFDLFVPSSELECINIPNSFTPNEDGTNDTWVVRNIYLYPGNSVKIFNRWGKLLYEASPYDPEWDGTYDGKPLPAETYYYIINLNNGTAPFTGTVTIVR